MFFYFTFRLISSVTAFLYPGYASYKTLSQRPASEVELERWLMYWSVLGCIVGVEYVAEWLICWLPFYYPLKTVFLLYLALPQTAGSSHLYKTYVQPFFASHETQIDSALSELKSVVYTYLQQLLRSAWGHVSTTVGQMQSGETQPSALDEGGITGGAAANTGPQPSLNDPASGPAQLAQTFWQSYGPSIVASGAALLSQAKRSAAGASTSAAQAMNSPPGSPRASHPAHIEPYDVNTSLPTPPVITLPTNNQGSTSRSSSSTSLRDRSGSGNGRSTFEEVEVPSDMEGEGHVAPQTPPQGKRASWFGWGGNAAKGYERLKSD